jgi:hypothetical protein
MSSYSSGCRPSPDSAISEMCLGAIDCAISMSEGTGDWTGSLGATGVVVVVAIVAIAGELLTLLLLVLKRPARPARSRRGRSFAVV